MVYHFSYGSNMNQESMDNYCTETGRPLIDLRQRSPRKGILKDHKLDFNYYSRLMGGGAGNAVECRGEHIEGIVFDLSEEDMVTIDGKEAAPDYFHRKKATITLEDGTELPDVVVYVAVKDKERDFTPPTHAYKRIIIEGAKDYGLSEAWIKKLEAIPSQDPDFES